MSALSAIDTPVPSGPGTAEVVTTHYGDRRRGLRVVRQPFEPVPGRAALARAAREPRSSSIAGAARPGSARAVPVLGAVVTPPRAGVSGTVLAQPRARVSGTVLAQPRARVSGTPIRLTKRGRVVVTALVVTGLTIAALLVSLLASGGAQATNHGQARAGYQGMHRIVVQPGQTLWSIASAAEPTADTRIVVQEIMTANALTSTTISAGQLIWVPR